MSNCRALLLLPLTLIVFLSSAVVAEETKECSVITLPSGMVLHCPRREEPEKTECCYEGNQPLCCLPNVEDQRLVMIIALSVIVTCFVLTVLVVICCFCPHCLLYDACRAKYTRGEIMAYTKDEEMALNSTMPYEDQTEKSSYSTQPIKIKPIADV